MSDKANESVWKLIKDAFDKVLHLVYCTRKIKYTESLFQGYTYISKLDLVLVLESSPSRST